MVNETCVIFVYMTERASVRMWKCEKCSNVINHSSCMYLLTDTDISNKEEKAFSAKSEKTQEHFWWEKKINDKNI